MSGSSASGSGVDSGYARLIELLAVKFVPRSFIDGDILCMVSSTDIQPLDLCAETSQCASYTTAN
jgi:hypothetical protein